ncbi:hypothetical protein CPLU01_03610 [Colletotrichum plurivorum]|uniref:NAD-dependent epimerase/dehydratase domain-containing protein n=1 Tax=Colletotrichum plurivorum TaxID=2175906 RepID=A0A8H6KS84_9PEZI|nr:hypothetical protein CPLU01_03610 [Colletotrichum plurivorum]
MKVLIIGGTGMIGAHAALHLRSLGHSITISGRRPPTTTPSLAELPFLAGDYLEKDDFPPSSLSQFEAIVFAAGSDVRHVPQGSAADEHYLSANGSAVPAFARLARDAGVKVFVHIGSAYPHVVPEKVAESAYVRSRKLAADGITQLAGPEFFAVSLDAPIVVGGVPDIPVAPFFQASVQYAEGKLPIPAFAPPGGMNFISTRSLSEAISGALENAAALSGRAVLVGDENLTYAEYVEAFFVAVGNAQKLPVLEQDHPLMPRATRYAGDGLVRYEPDVEDVKLLGGYRRNDVKNAIEELVRFSKAGSSA